jgi:hypothetical protein
MVDVDCLVRSIWALFIAHACELHDVGLPLTTVVTIQKSLCEVTSPPTP